MENKQLRREDRLREAERRSNIVAGKMTFVFCLLTVALIFIVRLSQNFELWFITKAVGPARIISGVLFAAALAWFIISKVRKTDESKRIFSSALLTGSAATLFLVMLMYMRLGALRSVIWMLAAALLFFVYEIYALDFFLYSIPTVVSGLGVSLLSANGAFRGYENLVAVAAAVAVTVAAVAVSLIARLIAKNGSVDLVINKVKAQKAFSPMNVYIGSAAALAAFVGALFLPVYAIYFVAALAVVYLGFVIFYTVKLI